MREVKKCLPFVPPGQEKDGCSFVQLTGRASRANLKRIRSRTNQVLGMGATTSKTKNATRFRPWADSKLDRASCASR